MGHPHKRRGKPQPERFAPTLERIAREVSNLTCPYCGQRGEIHHGRVIESGWRVDTLTGRWVDYTNYCSID